RFGAPLRAHPELERDAEVPAQADGPTSTEAPVEHHESLRPKLPSHTELPPEQRVALASAAGTNLHVIHTEGHAAGHDRLLDFARQHRERNRADDRVRRRAPPCGLRSEEHTSELQSRGHLVCPLLLETKKSSQ